MSEKDYSKKERESCKRFERTLESVNGVFKKVQNSADVNKSGEIPNIFLGECSYKTTNAESPEVSPTREENKTYQKRERKNLLRARQLRGGSRRRVRGTTYFESVSPSSQSDEEKTVKCFCFKKCKRKKRPKIQFMNMAETIPRAFEYVKADEEFSFTKNAPKQTKKEYRRVDISEEGDEVGDDNGNEGDGPINRVKNIMQWYEKRKLEKESLEERTSLIWRPTAPPWEESVDDPVALRPTMVEEADYEETDVSGSSSQYSTSRNRDERPFGDAGTTVREERMRSKRRRRWGRSKDSHRH